MPHTPRQTAFTVLAAVSGGHLIHDLLQALLPAIYPMLKVDFALDFWQIGLITLANQLTAAVLQPLVGHYLDERPRPYSLTVALGFTLVGIVLLATGGRFASLVAAAVLIGVGASIFHPESSRIARVASGGRHGLAQSLFQTGGNAGSALGPLLAALVVLPYGRSAIAWFALIALAGMGMLWRVGAWFERTGAAVPRSALTNPSHPTLTPRQVNVSLAILVALVFSKFIYLTSLTTTSHFS